MTDFVGWSIADAVRAELPSVGFSEPPEIDEAPYPLFDAKRRSLQLAVVPYRYSGEPENRRLDELARHAVSVVAYRRLDNRSPHRSEALAEVRSLTGNLQVVIDHFRQLGGMTDPACRLARWEVPQIWDPERAAEGIFESFAVLEFLLRRVA